jgi:hypothetical protein
MNKETSSTTQASGSSSSPSPQTSEERLQGLVSQAISPTPTALPEWSEFQLLTAWRLVNDEMAKGKPLEGCLVPNLFPSVEALASELQVAQEWQDEMLSQAVTYVARVAAARPAPPTSGSS